MSNPPRRLEKAKPTDPQNLLPLQSFMPFNVDVWDQPVRRAKKAIVDAFVNLLPLQTVVSVGIPFSQFDWSNPHVHKASGAARDQIPGGGSIGPVPPSTKGFEWLARARRRNRR